MPDDDAHGPWIPVRKVKTIVRPPEPLSVDRKAVLFEAALEQIAATTWSGAGGAGTAALDMKWKAIDALRMARNGYRLGGGPGPRTLPKKPLDKPKTSR